MNDTPIAQPPVAPAEPINHSMLVSDINRQYPQCVAVFERYGIAGCGGEFGPPEPLFIFAAAHRVLLPELVTQLNQAVRGEWRAEPAPGAAAPDPVAKTSPGENLYKLFVGAALLVALTFGMTLGVINLTRIAFAQSYYAISGVLKQIHGHAQIFGWAGLFILGVAFHAVPRIKMVSWRPRQLLLVKLCFGLLPAGILLRAVAQPFAANPVWAVVLLGSALVELAAIGIAGWLIGSVVVRSEQPREFYEKFIWASVGWLGMLGLWNLGLVLQMVRHHATAVPALAEALFIHVALFGFITNIIFGFSLRVLPHFLGLRDSKVWAANSAFVLWNAAIFLRYPIERLAWIASVVELAAVVLYLWALGIFARRRTKIEIQGVDGAFARFIYLGYGWLLVAALVPFHADIFRLTASSRHTMAVGFITSLILGVGYRVLPIFNGVNLWSSRLLRLSFWSLAGGSTLPIAMAMSVVFEKPWAYAWAGVAGYLVLAAVAMFAWNLAQTLRSQPAKFTGNSLVTLHTRVAELLDTRPDLRPVLIHNGLGGLATMVHNPPPFVTIEFAARRHQIDPQPLIEALNQAIKTRPNQNA